VSPIASAPVTQPATQPIEINPVAIVEPVVVETPAPPQEIKLPTNVVASTDGNQADAIIWDQPVTPTPAAPIIKVTVTQPTPPATQPAVVVAIAPTTVPATPPREPVAEVAPIDPYTINVPASRVIHSFSSDDTAACWCELKLDRPQLEALRKAVLSIDHPADVEPAEYDHLAELPPEPATPLAWWKPSELVDLDLISVSDDKSRYLWAAISLRTGRVFLYIDRPIAFIGK
jgi:hypothetical protein